MYFLLFNKELAAISSVKVLTGSASSIQVSIFRKLIDNFFKISILLVDIGQWIQMSF